MRIIGGNYKGRKVFAPETEDTRPIPDRAKEALFNILGDIEGLSFLDTYAGSGTVGLEALSRGAVPVAAVESGALQVDTIRKNADLLGAGASFEIHKTTLRQWLQNDPREFDIVFADPPFTGIDPELLVRLAARAKRLFILKHPARLNPMAVPGMELVRERKYGNSALVVYKTSS